MATATDVAKKRVKRVDWRAMLREVVSADNVRPYNPNERNAFFAVIEALGADYILQTLSEGNSLAAIAMANSVPPTYMSQWVDKHINKEDLRDALRSSAGVYAAKAELSLDIPDEESKSYMAQVAHAKARAELYLSMAERLDPATYGPPMPVLPSPVPVSIVMSFDQQQAAPEVPESLRTPIDPRGHQIVDGVSRKVTSASTPSEEAAPMLEWLTPDKPESDPPA